MASFIIKAILDTFIKPLGYMACTNGYINGTEKTPAEGNCYPDLANNAELSVLEKNGQIRYVNKGASPEDILWERDHKLAEVFQIASSKTCPINTIPFNGSCMRECDDGYQIRNFYSSGKKQVECRASCNSGQWHLLNAAKNVSESDGGAAIFQQGAISYRDAKERPYDQYESPRTDWCYHVSDNDTSTNTVGYTSRWPIGVVPFQGNAGDVVGQAENTFTIKFPGIYGERMSAFLGQPKMAGSCPPPNVPTDSQCLRPPPKGYTVMGNEWVSVTPCPAVYSTESTSDKTRCIPTPIYRRSYGSPLDYILLLAAIIIIIIVFTRIVK